MTAKTTFERARRLIQEYSKEVDARLDAAAAARAAEGCINIPYLCSVAEDPDQIPEETRTHIRHCNRCAELYQSALKGYPYLPRPDWLPSAANPAPQTAPVPGLPALRQPMALVLMKDQEKMDREWARTIDPHYSFLRNILKHLPPPLQRLFGLYSDYRSPDDPGRDKSDPQFDRGNSHQH